MNGETLHDALTLLPADLITAADRCRRRQKTIPRWTQQAAMAACMALVLCCGWMVIQPGLTKDAATEECAQEPAAPEFTPEMAAPEAAPMENGSGGSDICENESVMTDAAAPALELPGWIGSSTPLLSAISAEGEDTALVLRSCEELANYLSAQESLYDLSELAIDWKSFDENWFLDRDLLVVRLPRSSNPVPLSLTPIEDGWMLTIGDSQSSDRNCHHLAIPLEKDQITTDDLIFLLFPD